MIRQMGMEYIFILMERSMKGIGKKTSRMGLESRAGLMEPATKDIIKMERNMGKGN
jgi:hypothetical protein